MNRSINASCNESLELTSNYFFWGSKAVKLAMAPPAIIFNLLLIIVLRKCSLLHVNVRYLLINLCVCSLCASIYILVKSTYTILAKVFGPPCIFEVTFMTCKYQEIIFIFAKLPVICSMLGLSIERAYASWKIDTYEKNDSPGLAKIILLITWTFSLLMSIMLVATVNDYDVIPYCNSIFIYNPISFKILCGMVLPMELLGVIAYLIRWYKTSKQISIISINQAQYNLSGRLQKFLTLSLTATMLPSIILHALCWFTIFGFATVQITLIHLSFQDQLILSQYLFYGLCLLHMTLHPLVCFYKCDTIRYELLELFPKLQRFVPPSKRLVLLHQFENEEQKHFELLYSMWNIDSPQKNQKKKLRHQETQFKMKHNKTTPHQAGGRF